MTAPRTCGRCGAQLPPDVRWCLRCFEPVRQLTPREPQLPPLRRDELVDPSTIRADHAPLRFEEAVYSRIRGGPTTFGLWGRLVLTALILFFLPWGPFTVITVLYLVAYVPIASLLLFGVWRRDVIGPVSTELIVHEERTVRAIRRAAALVGGALLVLAVAERSSLLGYLPALPFLAVGLFRGWARSTAEAIDQARARPLGAFLLLNVLNVLDLVLSDAAIGAGVARELNPLVLAIGPWAKLALVAGLGAVLLWKRPDALVWPSIVFVVLTAYHLSGLLGNLAFVG